MSTRCAATATLSPICSEGARPTRASGIGERGQHAVAGREIAIRQMTAAAKWMPARKFLAVLSQQVAIAQYCLSFQ
jgi:hypothetical protein